MDENELQPCGHPIQVIRSTPYIGNQHSNYCGWCADVEHEHELCQTLTAELLAYREKVARLREALGKAWRALGQRASVGADGTFWYCRLCKLKHGKHEDECPFAALSDTADDWLARHDAEVRTQERERCQWVALQHNAPELIEAARIIASAIGEADDE